MKFCCDHHRVHCNEGRDCPAREPMTRAQLRQTILVGLFCLVCFFAVVFHEAAK